MKYNIILRNGRYALLEMETQYIVACGFDETQSGGLINVEAEYQSEEKAKMDGYSYAFYSRELGKKVYSKCLDDRGLYHTFALIVGYN